jgi:hypothetical protein
MAKPMTSEAQAPVKEMRVQEALRDALRYEMARDSRVFVMGELMWRSSAGLTGLRVV